MEKRPKKSLHGSIGLNGLASMPNHPNRSPQGLSSNPSPADILAAREAAGLTQTAAAELVYAGLRGWQEWEAGTRRMHPGLWELFVIKASP